MKLLITGASGFIGTHLARHCVEAGLTVTGLDTRYPREAVDGVTYVIGNVCDIPHTHALIGQTDTVAHLASTVGYAYVMADVEGSVATTSVGTNVVVKACLAHNKPLLFTSTSAVYGHGNHMDRVQGAKETDALRLGPTTTPSWAYAYAKAAAECQVLAAHRERQLRATVVRLFNVVGPYQSAAAGFVLPRFIRAALAGESLKVYSPGTQTRTFVHVQDVVEGLFRLITTGAGIGHVMNLGGAITLDIKSLALRVIQTLHSKSGWYITAPPYQGYEEIRERRPDLTKARRLIGYQPTRSLEQMIEDTAEAIAPEVLV